MTDKKKRDINAELLRVLAMILIVSGHYIYTGVKKTMDPSLFDVKDGFIESLNYVTMELLWLLAGIGVDCFVMITGYYMIGKETMRWGGALKTWAQTLFYSSTLFIVGALCFNQPATLEMAARAFLPINQKCYWFVTSYVGLLFIAPFLSRLANTLTQRQYQWLLAVMFLLTFQFLYGKAYLQDTPLGVMTFMFLTAGYVRKYSLPDWWRRHTGRVVLLVWALLFLVAAGKQAAVMLWTGNSVLRLTATSNSGLTYFLALAVFVWFVYHKPFSGKILLLAARLSPYCFGVYLIHQHFYVNYPLWSFAVNTYHEPVPMLLHCILWAAAVFLACCLIDWLRAWLFKVAGIDRGIARLSSKIEAVAGKHGI